MGKKRLNRIITYLVALCLLAGVLAGCGAGNGSTDGALFFHGSMSRGESETAAAEETGRQETETAGEQDLYLVVAVDQIEESMRLYRYANGMEYRYYYGTRTRFHDKYGGHTTVMNFTAGSVVTLGNVDSEGLLREAQVSDRVWVYDGITRFAVEEERRVFEIAGKRYKYDDSTYVFSGDSRVSMAELSKGDTLSVVGMDKQILSVNVTTGQGVLRLENTKLFEGSYLQLGTKIFAEITPDMQLPVEEGTYKLIVANNGWGGNRDVTVVRGEMVTVDLDELKGEGPKVARIRFVIDVANAVLVLDGKERDYTNPLEITYGTHSVGVYANGYDLWERNLYVNSEEATIMIRLKDEEKETVSTAGSENTDNSSSGSSDNSELTDAIRELIQSQQQQNQFNVLRDLLTSTAI